MQPYEWAVLRVVPRVERCEFVNAAATAFPAAASGPADDRSTCSSIWAYSRAAAAAAVGQLCAKYSAAPWSINHVSACQRNKFGLRHDRSTFCTKASNQTTVAASSGETLSAAGSNPSARGR